MYRFWNSVIRPTFEMLQPRGIVEIGCSSGMHTALLLEYCKDNQAVLHSIDTMQIPLGPWTDHPCFRFHLGKSLDILPQLPSYDAVLIDGDHNWYTVFHELKEIEKTAKTFDRFPLVFLHDVNWPYGRRDLYYNPENIPSEFRHSVQQGGMILSKNTLLQDDGINHDLMHAGHEDGERNGVRTAIEDFLKVTSFKLRFFEVPGFFGLGIVADERVLDAHPELRKAFASFTAVPTIAHHIRSMEHARLEAQITQEHADSMLRRTYSALLDRTGEDLRGQLNNLEAIVAEVQKTYDRQVSRLTEENTRKQHDLKQYIRRLESGLSSIKADFVRMERSRSWRITAPLRHAEAFLVKVTGTMYKTAYKQMFALWNDSGRPFKNSMKRLDGKKNFTSSSYPSDLLERETITYAQKNESRIRAKQLQKPTFTLVLKLETDFEVLARDGLNSILEQTYDRWELLVFHDEKDSLSAAILNDYRTVAGDRLIIVRRKSGSIRHISLSDILQESRNDLIVPIMQHDLLAPHMLERMASAYNESTEPPAYIVSSYDHITPDKLHHTPVIAESAEKYLQVGKHPYRGNVAVHRSFVEKRLPFYQRVTLQSIGAIYPRDGASTAVTSSILYHRLQPFT
jgi:hypothetical protein